MLHSRLQVVLKFKSSRWAKGRLPSLVLRYTHSLAVECVYCAVDLRD